jgi:hypothetical protein
MGGRSDPRFDYIVVPGMTLGLILSLIAVALSIAQFAIQLKNNEGTVIGLKTIYDNKTSHVDAPVLSLCGPVPFVAARTRCLFYENGLRPVKRGIDYPNAVFIHKFEYGLSWCNGAEGDGDEFTENEDMIFHSIYAPLAGERTTDFLGNEVLINYGDSKQGDEFNARKEVYYCVTFSKSIIPSYLGEGAAKRTFFELEYASENDFENYILKLWDPVEVRTPIQAYDKLYSDPTTLYSGKTLTIPYSVPGTALFTTWIAPFDGPRPKEELIYGDTNRGNPQYGPVTVRAGVSAVIKLQEEGTQSLDQEDPVYYYLMTLDSLAPEIEYPYTDTSKFVTLAFIWNDDDTFYYQTVLQITNVGMAALLITTVASSVVAVADGTAIYLDWEERNEKS